MNIHEIETEIKNVEAEIAPLSTKLTTLKRQLSDTTSRNFVQANGITKDQVEMSSGDGKPRFGTCWEFGKWLKANSNKRWAQWNTMIFHTADLVAGRMPDTGGRIDDLSV